MNDPRHRAPFAHQSSSIDLRSQYGTETPPQTYHALLHANNYPTNGGVAGGPGYFAQPPPSNGVGAKLASVASGLLNGLKMERKSSDMDNLGGYYDNQRNAGLGLGSLSNGWSTGDTQNATWQRIQSALPSAASVRFVVLCFLWYASSAISSNSGKVILNNFKFPVTLTIVQFAFVAGLCWLGSRPQLNWTSRLRNPTKPILQSTLPMAVFQVGGHIFGSLAMSRVPVSTVHTIKALSPLVTVAAYALLFGVKYSPATYLSLLPLTLGVMLACSFDVSLSNVLGLVCAFGSTIVFVSQNIFFKKVMPSPGSAAAAHDNGSPRLDKINLLYFSSSMAFLLMIPIWLYSDVGRLINLWANPPAMSTGTATTSTVLFCFFVNGTVHFAQNVLAFAILSSTSPVTYSIASLVKRIAVICLAIVWFKQAVHGVQAAGIMLTAVGLWMYNNAKRDVDKGEKKMRQVEAQREGMLPTSIADQRLLSGRDTPEPQFNGYLHPHKEAHASPRPTYPANFESVSTSTALRSPVFAIPPPPRAAKPPPPLEQMANVYPSPPASTASSPPLPSVPLKDGSLPSPVALSAGV